jgi:hypothetical protein
MTLSYSKFLIDSPVMSEGGVAVRCKVCGTSDLWDEVRLDDAIEWAESHECTR